MGEVNGTLARCQLDNGAGITMVQSLLDDNTPHIEYIWVQGWHGKREQLPVVELDFQVGDRRC